MAYVKTIWVDDTAPDIDAENLNKMEKGIFTAHTDIQKIVDGDTMVGKAQLAIDLDASFVYPDYITPVGSVTLFGDITAPDRWVECDGRAVNRVGEYASLYTVIGNNYGDGDGSSTFNLPDMRGQFARGWDNGAGIDPARNIGTNQADELKAHNHTVTTDTDDSRWVEGGDFGGGTRGHETSTTSSVGGAETRPKNVSFMYIIKYK